MTRVPFLKPTFPPVEEVAADYAQIVRNAVFANGGDFERRFAGRLEQWVGNGVSACLVSSGTAAIDLAVRATFREGRSRALMASFTFAAGPLTLRRAGYEPVLLDIDPDTWQPDITEARRFLSRSSADVAGVLLTATLGVADAAVHEWEELAQSFKLPLVLDSAAGFGSAYPWMEPMGARGDCEVFSFHATKTLAVGEGGALLSRNAELVEKVRAMRNFGFDAHRLVHGLGTNAKLPELSSALGLRQLDRLPQRLDQRRAVQRAYSERLAPCGVTMQPGAQLSAVAFVSALLPTPCARDAALVSLTADHVECRRYYDPPVHRQPHFVGLPGVGELRVTNDICSRVLSLPTADVLPADVIDRVGAVMERVT
jgi:dTDP-4-amino-4,6-dideoxygalactose transaminase